MTFRYIVRRLVQGIVVLVGVSVIVFSISRLSGDPAVLMAGPGATADDLQLFRERLGLDQPLPVQYVKFFARAAQGDFGDSIWQKQPALSLVLERLPFTILLTSIALVLSLVIAIPVGVLAAVSRGTWKDQALMAIALLGQAIPIFWLGLMLILVFAETLHWLPSSGVGSWKHYILPAITLGAFSMARTARLVRSGMLEVLSQDFIRTARAKGITERSVLVSHASKNVAIPVVTVVGLEFGVLLGGAVLTETIFALPGMGRLVFQAILQRDFPLIQAAVFIFSLVFIVGNLVVDLLYLYLDPRIRYT